MTLFLIPGLPLAAFVLLILIGRRLGRWSAWVSVAALAGSCALTWSIAGEVLRGHRVAISWAWLAGADGLWRVGLVVDGLAWLMLAIVTTVGTLIQLYSIGYMAADPRYSRFFAYLSLFCASMLTLVMADHFVLLYVGWELVGLCSYLLISFWFEKPAAAAAGRKAFLTTRIGDTGLLVGILLLAFTAGSLHFDRLESIRDSFLMQQQGTLLTVISVLIFLGAVGKSAQVPLHVWLPDAMEGPTPVSALIHAATMVAAGVYLVARTLPLFTPQALAVVLAVGLVTHLAAGTVALTMTDIKRVLAYSTISQLGLMMTALGLGAGELAMFHLTTHAWFKALLFLGAGSVIHATHTQELGELGGLFRQMPVTAATFLIGAVAMAGVFPLSGFWSKDAVLLAARHDAPWLFWCLLGGALMTAGYVFRLYLRCFHGSAPAHHGAHAHESPLIMTVPLVLLAAGSAAVGLLGVRFVPGHHEGVDPSMLVTSTVIAAAGILLAWQVGIRRRRLLPAVAQPLGARVYRLVSNKYFIDELYDRLIVQPFLRTTARLSRFDLAVIDGTVDRTGLAGRWVSHLKDRVDRRIVDRLVNGVAEAVRAASAWGRTLQTGLVHHYLFIIVGAAVVLAVWVR